MKTPFKKLWNIINQLFGAIGLISFSQDKIEWVGFLNDLVLFYETIVDIPWSVLHIDIWEWLKHYLFFGVLWYSSSIQATKVVYIEELQEFKSRKGQRLSFLSRLKWFSFGVYLRLSMIVMWVFWFLWHFTQIFKQPINKHSKMTFNWFGAIFLLFFFFFLINSLFK